MKNENTKYIETMTRQLMAVDSPSGFTHDAMEYVRNVLSVLGYEMQTTKKGNGYVFIPGENADYTVGLSAHIDTLGLMVRSITPEGTLKVTAIGGPIVPTLDAEYCRIYTRDDKVYTGTILSTSPAIHVHPNAASDVRTLDTIEVRIDEVVHTKEDVEKLGIAPGDIIAYETKTEITPSGFIKSRFIDDKISVVILLDLLRVLQEKKVKPKNNLVILFSTYEEVGHGMAALPQDVTIDELISVDMGCIGLDLSCTEYDVSICAKDSSGPYDYGITSKFIQLADEHEIPHAVDIYPMYGSDTSAALRGGNDIKGGLIGPGVHASHGMERTHIDGVVATRNLLFLYILQ